MFVMLRQVNEALSAVPGSPILVFNFRGLVAITKSLLISYVTWKDLKSASSCAFLKYHSQILDVF